MDRKRSERLITCGDEGCSGSVLNKNKRKRNIGKCTEGVREDCEVAAFDQVGGQSDVGFTWKNLQLILSLQDADIDALKKVDLALEHMRSWSASQLNNIRWRPQVIDTGRTMGFLNNWIQSVLIASSKKMRQEGSKPTFGTPGSFLDFKCWKVLHLCLEESKGLHFKLHCPKDFLRVIHDVFMEAFCSIDADLFFQETIFCDRLEFYSAVLECSSLVFSYHGGVANENLESWISLTGRVIGILLKRFSGDFDDSKTGNVFSKLACCFFEPFSRFLRIHPIRKNAYHTFIDDLLGPLLHLLHVMNINSSDCDTQSRLNLHELLEEILACGLFHPIHIDGFLNLQTTYKYKNSLETTAKEKKLVNKSYHRHLFNRIEKMVADTNRLALCGLGQLLHVFFNCVSRHNQGLIGSEVLLKPELGFTCAVPNNSSLEKADDLMNIPVSQRNDAELRRFTFDYFVQICEYLLEDLNKYSSLDRNIFSQLDHVSSVLVPINNLLSQLISDRIYLRTEDTDGASKNFLRSIYDILLSISARLFCRNTSPGFDEKSCHKFLASTSKELIAGIKNLLIIEYDVIGDDIEGLWTTIFSFIDGWSSPMEFLDQPFLSSEILRLECRLIDIYGELRKVDSCIFALCRALRNYLQLDEMEVRMSCSANSLSMVLCSSDFRACLINAVKTMPEGRVAGCLQQLSLDAKDSLNWVSFGNQMTGENELHNLDQHNHQLLKYPFQAELLGKVLGEVYVIILDSITVTAGNSHRAADCLKDMIEIVCVTLRRIISLESGSRKETSLVVYKKILKQKTENGNIPMNWALLFLFRVLLSSRSLFRELMSLMPLKSSKKNSDVIGDSFSFISGGDWLKMTNFADKDVFSFIIQPSASLLATMQSVSNICIHDSVIVCPPVVYISSILALQRLVDLNRFIESFHYMLQWKQKFELAKFKDDIDMGTDHLEKIYAQVRNEARDLTKFILGFLDDPSFELTPLQIMDHMEGLKLPIGSLDNKSLQCALWSILYRDIDIWCSHASKKDLKNFIKLPIRACLSCAHDPEDLLQTETMRSLLHQLTFKLLSCPKPDKQRFACSYMASKLCRYLQKSVCSLFVGSKVSLSETPDWINVISALDKTTHVLSAQKKSSLMSDASFNQKSDVKFWACQLLLNILMQMPEEILSSFSLYFTYILNLERFLVDKLLGSHGSSSSDNPHMIFQLLVDCRKVLHKTTVSITQENGFAIQSSSSLKLMISSSFIQWVLKSVLAVCGFKFTFPHNPGFNANDTVFSLLNLTSNLVRRVSKYHYELGSSTHISDSNEHSNSLESVSILFESLEEHFKVFLASLQYVMLDQNEGNLTVFELNKISSLIASFQALLWGLASASIEVHQTKRNPLLNFLCSNVELSTRIKSCTKVFVEFVAFVLKALFVECDEDMIILGCEASAFDTSTGGVPSDMKGNPVTVELKGKFSLPIPNLESLLTEVQHWKPRLRKSFLLQILQDENYEAAFLLQQIFLASSAILRLNLQIDLSCVVWSIFPIMFNISQFLLFEFSRCEIVSHHVFTLGGIINFIEELGSYFPLFDPTLSKNLFTDLITLHLRVIGKCISIHGKEYRVVSEDTASHVNKPVNCDLSEFSVGSSQLEDFKERLRKSFITYVKKSTEFHLLSAIQAIRRALVGVQEGLVTNYEIVCHGSSGGEVSSIVSAAIDGFDMILESVSGPKRFNMIKSHITDLVSCLLNIILHVQGPNNFCVNSTSYIDKPPSGLTILMCSEVLTKVLQKSSRLRIDSSHLASSIHFPGALFRFFLQLHNDALVKTCPNQIILSKDLSVKLYNGCCRVLSSAIKHQKDETQQCIALLEDSVTVLLQCLEIVHTHAFAGWEIEEAVSCASSLRRVYEEIRQQKDVFGKYSFQFLAHYICVYCGLGPAKCGITREVDEALRPGIYALLDSCSPDDLQFLHSSFGEGPRRTILASLQHDYKINFQFQGKV